MVNSSVKLVKEIIKNIRIDTPADTYAWKKIEFIVELFSAYLSKFICRSNSECAKRIKIKFMFFINYEICIKQTYLQIYPPML